MGAYAYTLSPFYGETNAGAIWNRTYNEVVTSEEDDFGFDEEDGADGGLESVVYKLDKSASVASLKSDTSSACGGATRSRPWPWLRPGGTNALAQDAKSRSCMDTTTRRIDGAGV